MRRGAVVLLPGFGGRADQPILVRLSQRLEATGLRCHRVAPPRRRPTPGLEAEAAWLGRVLADVEPPLALVGRSFGGRVALRCAGAPGVVAVVVLGLPLRPPGRPRPLDEAALAMSPVPTLVVQGARDPLGPLPLVRRVAARCPRAEVLVVKGATHAFGRAEAGALDAASDWLSARMR